MPTVSDDLIAAAKAQLHQNRLKRVTDYFGPEYMQQVVADHGDITPELLDVLEESAIAFQLDEQRQARQGLKASNQAAADQLKRAAEAQKLGSMKQAMLESGRWR